MIDLKQIKTILQVAGISELKLKIDKDHENIEFDYVFRGKPGKKNITFREIESILSIGRPKVPDKSEKSPSMSVAQRAGCVLDTKQELE